MKNPLFHLGLAITATVLLSTYLLFHVAELEKQTKALKASLNLALADKPKTQEPVELADVMEKLQRHSNKLYFAGRSENWDLAAFYLEEIEETVKGIEKKDVMEGQINISGLMQGLILPEVEKLETAVKSKDNQSFQKQYHALTSSCNACHVTANHPYIVIQAPHVPVMDNQQYEPIRAVAGK